MNENRKRRILIVDDEVTICKLLQITLSPVYETMGAHSADDALMAIQDFHPDVIISDIKMPGKDGFWLINSIQERSSKIPVIFITGHGNKRTAVESLRLGAFDFIEKPFDHDVILARVEKAILKIELEESLESAQDQIIFQGKLASIGEVSASMVHEVTNPLGIIFSLAQKIESLDGKSESYESEVRSCTEKIIKAYDRANKIIDSFKHFSRYESNDPFETMVVKDVVSDSLLLCESRFFCQGIEFSTVGGSPELKFDCRGISISQILLNLFNNACDALEGLDEKWVKVIIEDGGELVNISVIDSGKGISDSCREKILNPFFTTKAPGRGTGLGLSISKKIAENHGGDLEIDDDCSNTKFILTIPKTQSEVSS